MYHFTIPMALMDYVPQGIANAGSLEQLNAVYAPHVQELIEKGQEADLERIKEDIRTRDYQDMNRTVAPLRQAEDAVVMAIAILEIAQQADVVAVAKNLTF